MLTNIAILHWPEQAAVVAYLRAQGHPRLLLVAPDAEIPATEGWDEDWVRLPARDDDVRARASALAARTGVRSRPRPDLKPDGRLFFADRWVGLSPTEQQMTRILTDAFEEIVEPQRLAVASDGHTLSQTAVRVHLTRLRKRLRPIGLTLRTVRGRGYVLEVAEPAAPMADSQPAAETADGDTAHLTAGPTPEMTSLTQGDLTPLGRATADHAQSGAEIVELTELTEPETRPIRRLRQPARPRRADRAVIRVGDLLIDGPRHQVEVGGERVDLTPTEFEFLAVLARHAGEVVPQRTILEEVWGPDIIDTQYLRVYARKLRNKLDRLAGAPRLATVPYVGYQLIEDEPPVQDPDEER